MQTILKPAMYKILKLFYQNKNQQLHLREIARRTNLNESAITRHLNNLSNEKILKTEKEANLKKFSIRNKQIPKIFLFFDNEKLDHLPLLRRNAIKEYINHLEKKPVLMITFGSTAKGTFKDDSDLDILEVYNNKQDNKKAEKEAEKLTGIKIQVKQLTEKHFYKELIEKKDQVIQSALNTGFPIFNKEYYYGVIYHE